MRRFRVVLSLEEARELDGKIGMHGFFDHEWRVKKFDTLEAAKEYFDLVNGDAEATWDAFDWR